MRFGRTVAVVAAVLLVSASVAAAAPLEAGASTASPSGAVDAGGASEANAPVDRDGTATITTDENATWRVTSNATQSERNATPGALEIHTLNVGQADAVVVVGPSNETMLIDSGDWRDDGETVLAALEARGIDRIDHLVATHGHADHIGGHEAVIDHFEGSGEGVGAAYDSGVVHTSQTYERYLDAIERHDVPLYEVRAGDEIPMPNVTVEVLNPPTEGVDRESGDLHENSVVLKLTYGTTSFLLTGDAEADVERRLVETDGEDLAADVYWAGHHGSDTSSSAPFLEAVDPAVAVVSSAYDSQYGHPHDETLERLAGRSVATFWTATHGTIALESDGSVITVRTQAAAPTDPTAIREGEGVDADPAADPLSGRELVAENAICAATAVGTDGRSAAAAG